MTTPSLRARVGFIDAARTLAMAMMVLGHVCDNLLSPAGKASWFYQHYLPVRGLTGPLFFFLSGFAFVVASDHAWFEYGRPGPRLWGRLRRVATLLAVGWFLQVPRWSGPRLTRDEWGYVFRSGVLHAIALGLFVALLLIAATRSKRAFTWAAFVLAVLAVVAAPFASASRSMPAALGLFVRTQEGSLFPVVPWTAHFLFGAVAGRLHLDTSWLSSPRRLALVVGTAGVVMRATGTTWLELQPADTNDLAVWVSHPAVFLSRAGLAWSVFSGFALLLGNLASRPWLQLVASHALSVFVAHLVALYGWPGMPGLVQRIGPTLSVTEAYLLGPALFVACSLVIVGGAAVLGRLRKLGRLALARAFPAAGIDA